MKLRDNIGRRQRPFIRLNTHAPDQTTEQPQHLHCTVDLAAPNLGYSVTRLGIIFMSFRGLQAQIDKVQPGDMGDTMYRLHG
jgi:hypothetical protein